MCGLLIEVASLVAEHRLQGTWASVAVITGLSSTGSVVVACRLSCSVMYGIFLDQGLNLCLLHWHMDSLSLSHLGSTAFLFIYVFLKLKYYSSVSNLLNFCNLKYLYFI